MEGQRHILEGIKVLDFAHALAGPTVTRLMAEMGTEIIKIEPPEGDMVRKVPFIKNGRSGYFVQQNRGKKSRNQASHPRNGAALLSSPGMPKRLTEYC